MMAPAWVARFGLVWAEGEETPFQGYGEQLVVSGDQAFDPAVHGLFPDHVAVAVSLRRANGGNLAVSGRV